MFCLVLCTVPDDRRAISEAARVLRPGGRFLAVEHVRSPNPFVRFVERLWEPIAVRRDGDHVLRDPIDHLPSAGFTIETLERSRLGLVERIAAVRAIGLGQGVLALPPSGLVTSRILPGWRAHRH